MLSGIWHQGIDGNDYFTALLQVIYECVYWSEFYLHMNTFASNNKNASCVVKWVSRIWQRKLKYEWWENCIGGFCIITFFGVIKIKWKIWCVTAIIIFYQLHIIWKRILKTWVGCFLWVWAHKTRLIAVMIIFFIFLPALQIRNLRSSIGLVVTTKVFSLKE